MALGQNHHVSGLSAPAAAGTAGTLDTAERSGASCPGHRGAAPDPGQEGRMPGAGGGQHRPGRLIGAPGGAPIPSPRSPGSRLPDGGRFLLSRLTARLNIAASTPGRKEEQPGCAAAEPEEGEEEEAAGGGGAGSAPPRSARPPPCRPLPRQAPRGAIRAPYRPAPVGARRSRPGVPGRAGRTRVTPRRQESKSPAKSPRRRALVRKWPAPPET